MNIRPTQSVPTLGQRRQLEHYLALQRQADRERRIAAEQHPAALIERSKQPANFCAPAEIEAEDSLTWPRLFLSVAAGLVLWALIGWAAAPFVGQFIASLQRISP